MRAPWEREGEVEPAGAEGLRLWNARDAPWRAAEEVMPADVFGRQALQYRSHDAMAASRVADWDGSADGVFGRVAFEG